jgi:hypothetical protein
MIAVFMAVVIIGIGVSAYFSHKHYSKKKADAQEKIERLEGAHIFKMKILGNLLKMKNKSNYKARLMEELSMEIEMLKVCVAQLKAEKLITESPHFLTLTDFGKKYAQVYVEQELKNAEEKK